MQINPDSELNTWGGKAFNLHRLQDVCHVPPFYVICFQSPDEIEDGNIQEQLLRYWDACKYNIAAVRSSASVEDSYLTSFAGIFDTVLGVTRDNLIIAIKKVLDSVNSQRVIDYCKAHSISKTSIQMSVIVQRLVSSRVAGVCFTKTKQTGDHLIIEACFGLGEALVSGKITPDTYLVNRETLIIESQKIGYQTTSLQFDNHGKVVYQPLPFFKRNAKKLTNDEIKEIAKVSLLIEKQLSIVPCDIEWAFEKDTLLMVQARHFTEH